MSGYEYFAECLVCVPALKRSFATPEEREEWMAGHAAATADLDPVPWPTPHNFHSWAVRAESAGRLERG